MKRRERMLFVLLAVAILLAGCSRPSLVHGTDHPALNKQPPIGRVAVVPFTMSEKLLREREAAVSAEVMAHQTAEALTRRGKQVVPPSDVARAMQANGIDLDAPALLPLAQLVAREFGADALAMGRVHRWREREGSAAASAKPASVGFELTLRAAPGGQKLWSAVFDETQKSAGENVLVTSQYPGAGTRWLTAEELGGWGASEVVGKAPLP